MVYEGVINSGTVKVIKNNWENDTIIVVNLKRRGAARLFWANNTEVENQSVSTEMEIQPGESVYVVAEERNNLIILNQNELPQQILVEVSVNPVPPSFRPISATSGF